MIMFFQLENAKTRYDTTEKEALAVVDHLAEVWWLVIRHKYLPNLYTKYSALESIFIQDSNIHARIAHQMDKFTQYNYKVYYRLCKANIMSIADGISCLHAKYSQYATTVNLEKMIITITFFQS